MRKSILLAVVAGILASPANTANWFEFDSANHCDIDIAPAFGRDQNQPAQYSRRYAAKHFRTS